MINLKKKIRFVLAKTCFVNAKFFFDEEEEKNNKKTFLQLRYKRNRIKKAKSDDNICIDVAVQRSAVQCSAV